MSINLHIFIFHNNIKKDLKKTYNSIKKDACAISIFSREFVEDYDFYIQNKNCGVHHIFNKDRNYLDEINDLVREIDSHYYLVLHSGTIVKNIKKTIEKYLEIEKLIMVKPEAELNKLLVNSGAHLFLYGNQEQTIVEKLIIKSINDEQQYLILDSLEELYARTAKCIPSTLCGSNSNAQ